MLPILLAVAAIMAITFNATLATRIENAIGPMFNSTSGKAVFQNATSQDLCTIAFTATTFTLNDWINQTTGTVVATIPGGGGTCTKCIFTDSNGTGTMEVTCGLTGSDINFDDNVFTASGAVSITSFAITQPLS